jgi:hypothetical protein
MSAPDRPLLGPPGPGLIAVCTSMQLGNKLSFRDVSIEFQMEAHHDTLYPPKEGADAANDALTVYEESDSSDEESARGAFNLGQLLARYSRLPGKYVFMNCEKADLL